MKTELYRVIKMIDADKLTDADLDDLLALFMKTKNTLVRNHIAFIFEDAQYQKAVPFMIKKINQKGMRDNSGSLIFCLNAFDLTDYFPDLVKLICTHGYESRLMAYGIIEGIRSSISSEVKKQAVEILQAERNRLSAIAVEEEEKNRLEFIEQTIQLLKKAKIKRITPNASGLQP